LANNGVPKENKNAWFSLLINTTINKKSTDKLIRLLNGKTRIDKRWRILRILAVVNHTNILALLKKEKAKDPSDKGNKSAITVEAALLKNKEKFWNVFIKGKYSLDYNRAGMRGFYNRIQKPQMLKYSNLFFNNIIQVFEKKDRDSAKAYFDSLFPDLYISKDVIKKSKDFLKKNNKRIPQLLKKQMLENIDEMERGLKILVKYGG